MPPRPETLDLDLRYGHMRRAQQSQPRLPGNMRQLGAVGTAVPPPPPDAPRLVVKTTIARPSTTSAHLRYLQQGKGLDGQDAALFRQQGYGLDLGRVRQEAQRDPHQFRLVVAPVQATAALLTLLVQHLMRLMERSLRRSLDWLGAVHQDTAHLHAHVLLRGRDRHGKDLYLDKTYLTRGIGDQARTLARYVLGRERSPAGQTTELERTMARHVRDERRQEQGKGMER
jgi:type IV secretory pathway VirD2 relaxase